MRVRDLILALNCATDKDKPARIVFGDTPAIAFEIAGVHEKKIVTLTAGEAKVQEDLVVSRDTNSQVKTEEEQIVEKLIDHLLGLKYFISVDDGEEMVLRNSANKDAILKALRSTDLDYLWLRNAPNGSVAGFIMMVYGSGRDVISDYSAHLEDVMWPFLQQL